MTTSNLNYAMSKTGVEFHRSRARVKAVMGPVGSGKTVMCCWEIWFRANAMPVAEDGYRRARWAVVRNTYWELENTTQKSWFDWFGTKTIPAPYGKYTGKPKYEHIIDIPPVWEGGKRGGKLIQPGLHLHVLFIALDRAEDVDKLGSLEISGAYVNEAREVPYDIIKGISRRIGRYPAAREGGCPFPGIILDTNPPDDSHWWHEKDMVERPEDWDMWRQPSGLSPDAENIANLPGGQKYYTNMMNDLTEEEINVYVHGKYGYLKKGEPVFKNYNPDIHVAKAPLVFDPERPVYVGLDYGLTPAAVVGQRDASGQLRTLRELVQFNMSSDEFAPLLKQYLIDEFNVTPDDLRVRWEFYGDPSVKRSEVDKRVVTDSFMQVGIIVRPSPCQNVWETRRKAVNQVLSRLVNGQAGLLLDTKCKMLIRGFGGGYHFKRIPMSGGKDRVMEMPEKNEYSHVQDAFQYMVSGSGEVMMMRNSSMSGQSMKAVKVKMGWDPRG